MRLDRHVRQDSVYKGRRHRPAQLTRIQVGGASVIQRICIGETVTSRQRRRYSTESCKRSRRDLTDTSKQSKRDSTDARRWTRRDSNHTGRWAEKALIACPSSKCCKENPNNVRLTSVSTWSDNHSRHEFLAFRLCRGSLRPQTFGH